MEDRIGELEKRIAELECQFQAQQKRYKELIEDICNIVGIAEKSLEVNVNDIEAALECSDSARSIYNSLNIARQSFSE